MDAALGGRRRRWTLLIPSLTMWEDVWVLGHRIWGRQFLDRAKPRRNTRARSSSACTTCSTTTTSTLRNTSFAPPCSPAMASSPPIPFPNARAPRILERHAPGLLSDKTLDVASPDELSFGFGFGRCMVGFAVSDERQCWIKPRLPLQQPDFLPRGHEQNAACSCRPCRCWTMS